MYIDTLEITNVRGFAGTHTICFRRPDASGHHPYAGWTVLAGRNGAGKTTFLRALAIGAIGEKVARQAFTSFAGWIRKGEHNARVYLKLRPDYEQVVMDWKRSITAEPVWEDSVTSVFKDSKTGQRVQNPLGLFIAGYGAFRRVIGHTGDAASLMTGPPPLNRLTTLFREDASLAEAVTWFKDVNYRRLSAKAQGIPDDPHAHLEDTAITLLNDGLLRDGVQITRVDPRGLWARIAGTELPLDELSDGYRTVTTLVLDLLRLLIEHHGPTPLTRSPDDRHRQLATPGVVLIDEADVHLHVSWQQALGPWLKSRFPLIQFIVTSHSPFICQAADPGGLIRLPAPGEDRRIEHVDDETYRRVVLGNVNQAVLSDLFGLDDTRSPEAERLRQRLADIEARLMLGTPHPHDEAERKSILARLPGTISDEVERVLRRFQD